MKLLTIMNSLHSGNDTLLLEALNEAIYVGDIQKEKILITLGVSPKPNCFHESMITNLW